jgi:hypothetical protein
VNVGSLAVLPGREWVGSNIMARRPKLEVTLTPPPPPRASGGTPSKFSSFSGVLSGVYPLSAGVVAEVVLTSLYGVFHGVSRAYGVYRYGV